MRYIVKFSFLVKYINVQLCSIVFIIKIYGFVKYIYVLYRKDIKYILQK